MPYEKKDGKWIGQIRRKGVRIGKQFETKKEAKEWEVQQWQIPDEIWGKKDDMVSLLDWAEKYLDDAESRFSTGVYKEKCSLFIRFLASVNKHAPAKNLIPKKVLDYLTVQKNARSGYAANRDRKNLVAAWNWGVQYLGFPTLNPCRVHRFPEIRHPRYVPSEEDFWIVCDLAQGQDKVMILTYLYLAARKREIFRAKWDDDVNLQSKKFRLPTRKRKDGTLEYDWLPIGMGELYDALLQHRRNNHSEWVFPDPQTGEPYTTRHRWLKQLCKKAGVRPFDIHAIRHLSASIMADNGVAPYKIKDMLRHKSSATTDKYIRRLGNLSDVSEVFSRQKSRPIEPFNPIGRDVGIESAV